MPLKRIVSLLLVFAIPVLFYQNCGQDIQLNSPEVVSKKSFRLQGNFCPSVDAANTYSLQEFYVLNLTARTSRYSGRFLADSDMDGVADVEEVQYGFNPLLRRTYSILDSICLDAGSVNCQQTAPASFLTFGLMSNDLKVVPSPGVRGYDQDQDHIPDFVEILFGTLINQADGDISSDDINDGLTNIDEIKLGLAPRSNLDRNLSETFYTKVVDHRLDQAVDCANGQPGYSFKLQQLPLLDTLEFSSVDESYLNHAEGENLILFLVVSVTSNGVQEISYALKAISIQTPEVDIQISPLDFKNINQL